MKYFFTNFVVEKLGEGKLIKQASFGLFCGSFGPKWGQIVKNANLGTMGVHTGSHIIDGTNRVCHHK